MSTGQRQRRINPTAGHSRPRLHPGHHTHTSESPRIWRATDECARASSLALSHTARAHGHPSRAPQIGRHVVAWHTRAHLGSEELAALKANKTVAGKRAYARAIAVHADAHNQQMPFEPPVTGIPLPNLIADLLHMLDLNLPKTGIASTGAAETSAPAATTEKACPAPRSRRSSSRA